MCYYMQYIDDCQCIILKKNMNHSTHILNHLIHILLFITKIPIEISPVLRDLITVIFCY